VRIHRWLNHAELGRVLRWSPVPCIKNLGYYVKSSHLKMFLGSLIL